MQDQPERAVSVLAKMKQLNLQPDIRTYELLFSLFGNVNAPYEDGNILSQADAAKRINAIEMDMINNGFQHSHRSLNNLVTTSIAANCFHTNNNINNSKSKWNYCFNFYSIYDLSLVTKEYISELSLSPTLLKVAVLTASITKFSVSVAPLL